MPKFAVTVKEVLQRTVIVESQNIKTIEDAIEKVSAAVERSELVLAWEDSIDTEIAASDCFKDGLIPENKDVSYYFHLKN